MKNLYQKILLAKLSKIHFKKPQFPYQRSRKRMKTVENQETGDPSPNNTYQVISRQLRTQSQTDRQKKEHQIQKENEFLAHRLISIRPVVDLKDELNEKYRKNKGLKKRIQRFHELGERFVYHNPSTGNQINKFLFDQLDPQLYNERVYLYLKYDISLTKFDANLLFKSEDEDETYFFEIHGREGIRRTQPEKLQDFHKSVINEFFTFQDLLNSKTMNVAVYVQKGKQDSIIGDFDIDIEKYYLESGTYDLKIELRDRQTDAKVPHYVQRDLRRRGLLEFSLRVKSSLKKYLLDQLPDQNAYYQYHRGSIKQRASRVVRLSQNFGFKYDGRLSKLGVDALRLQQLNQNQKTKITTTNLIK